MIASNIPMVIDGEPYYVCMGDDKVIHSLETVKIKYNWKYYTINTTVIF